MIDDPIQLQNGRQSFLDLCAANIGGRIFIRETNDEYDFITHAGIPSDYNPNEFDGIVRLFRAENCGVSMWYQVDSDAVGQAEFFDNVMERYPDHFEWLLYHPEFWT